MVEQVILFFIINSTGIKELGDYGLEIIFTIEESNRQDFSFSEAVWLCDFGEPNLPSVVYTLGIPQDGSVEVKVLENQQEIIKNVTIDPVIPVAIYEPPIPEKIDEYGDVYKENKFFPKDLIQVSSPGYFRDIYTVDLRLNPAQYNPVLKELVISKRLKIAVKFKGKPRARPIIDKSFEEIYKRTIVNYQQCKDWRREPKLDRQNYFAGGVWFKIEVSEEGIYRIGYDEIKKAGLDPKQFDPKTMKVFTAGFDLLPRSVTQSFGDSLIEIPVYVEGEEDHQFDKDDYLVFYGFSASHFIPDSEVGWFENGYARNNVYWFTFGGTNGKRMEIVDATWNGATPDTLVSEILHIEEDIGNPTRSGTNWYWKDISPGEGPGGITTTNIKHPKANGAIEIAAGIFTLESPGPFWYQLSLDDNTLFSDTLRLPIHDQWPPYYFVGNGLVVGDSSNFDISITRPSGTTGKLTAYLNGLDILYERTTDMTQSFHSFFASPKDYAIKCVNINSKPFVLDITNLNEPKMDSLTIQNNTIYLSGRSDSFQLLYFSQSSLVYPANLIPVNPGKLRTEEQGCEYLFITHKNFYNGLMPLVNYRQKDYTTKVVTIDEIFDDFSFGKYDPLAIKHFLYWTMNNWTTYPNYVLLVGDATYDYKNNCGKENPPNFVPMYESGTILSGNAGMPDNYIYEGEYVNFYGNHEEMILGRITVRTKQELRDFIDKIITYETKDLDGIWNKRIILAGDDEWADNYKWEGPYEHCGACEGITSVVPDTLYDFAKLYMVSYPPFTYPTKKPNAQLDFIRVLNKGGLAGCFFGHGNTHQMAHEVLFYQESDIPLIKNGRRNFFYYFASCTIGRFDDSQWECIGEEFVRIKEGAIGTMAATSGTGVGTNVAIGIKLFDLITNPDTNLTMGECFRIAKESPGASCRIYVLIGDPATKFRKITDKMSLFAIPDSVKPLGKLKVAPTEKPYYLSAFIRDTTHIEKIDATTANRLSGHIYRKVQDGSYSDTVFDYKINGKEIYQGYWNQDTAMIIVPKILTTDLPVIKLTSFKNDKSGMLDSIKVFGSAAPSSDQTGPEVILYDGAKKLKDGDWVNKDFMLTGKVTDESGINLLNSKEDARGFYLYINQDIEHKIDLRDYFIYDQNSYTTGQFHTAIVLQNSVDTITINVADNNFNQTNKKIFLNTELFGQISINNLLIYPNPVRNRNRVWFTFNLTSSGVVCIKVFTIAGRLIKIIEDTSCDAGYNQIPWDGTDEYKDEISNGVYLVQVSVESENGNDEVIEKFIIAR